MTDNNITPANHPFAKLFSGIICLVFAFAISGVAAFFSITGLATIFSAAFTSVVVMGGVLETGKLVAAGWLHANWKNKRASFFHKAYLGLAVIALMIITAVGIYGYLSKAYLDQSAPVGIVDVQIQAYQQQIDQDNTNIASLTAEQKQMDAQINSLIAQNKVYLSNSIRKSQSAERVEVQSSIAKAQQDIISLDEKMEPLKVQESGTNAKLGPIKYVAALFGWTDLDAAVRLVILLIMFAFDPLAVVLLLSGTISIGEWMDLKNTIKVKNISTSKLEQNLPMPEKEEIILTSPFEPIIIPPVELEIVKQPVEDLVTPVEVETSPQETNEPLTEIEESNLLKIVSKVVDEEASKDETSRILIELFEKKPAIMQEVIDIITELNEKKNQ